MEEYSNKELFIILKSLQTDVKDGFIETNKRLDKSNGRLNSLEIWRGVITGFVALLAFMIPIILIFIK